MSWKIYLSASCYLWSVSIYVIISVKISRLRNCRRDDTLSKSLLYALNVSGIGKTSLVTKFYESQKHVFQKSSWISCLGKNSVASLQESLLKSFDVAVEAEDGFNQLVNKLTLSKSQSKWIIVIDDVHTVMSNDEAKFDELVCKIFNLWEKVDHGRCCLLLTSWSQASIKLREQLRSDLLCLNLNKMTETEGLELISHSLGSRDLPEVQKIHLMEACGGHPMMMTLLARHLRCSPDVSFEVSSCDVVIGKEYCPSWNCYLKCVDRTDV